MSLRYSVVESPIGSLLLLADASGLREIRFDSGRESVEDGWNEGGDLLDRTVAALAGYFDGTRCDFDLPLAPHGTPFQLRVWDELLRIPYGATISYGELARRIGRPSASRAVGAANGRNPLPIVVPCHRVIGSNGALTGFGGGLPIKRHLLALEGATAGRDIMRPLFARGGPDDPGREPAQALRRSPRGGRRVLRGPAG